MINGCEKPPRNQEDRDKIVLRAYNYRTVSGKTKVSNGTLSLPLLSFRLPSVLFFCFPFLPHSFPSLCILVSFVQKVPSSPNPTMGWEHRAPPSEGAGSPADRRYLVTLVHSELKIMLHMIALLHKFLDTQTVLVLALGHAGMVFLRKEVAVWFRAGMGSAVLSHFQPDIAFTR